ncbi:MAG: hypothetical protein FJ087_20435 [Deltaproteobacteria bacterium]|nr:hypothetical protein [Deltaproteobacteria bacterium]
MTDAKQEMLVPEAQKDEQFVVVNGRCIVRESEGMRTVEVGGTPLFHYAVGDTVTESLWMAMGVRARWAKPTEIVRAMGVSRVTLFRVCRRYAEEGTRGLLGKKRGPKGPRLGRRQEAAIRKWHGQEVSAREMGRRLCISNSTVLTCMDRLGLERAGAVTQEVLSLPAEPVTRETDASAVESPKSLGGTEPPAASPDAEPLEMAGAPAETSPAVPAEPRVEPAPGCAPEAAGEGRGPTTLDMDPADRSGDRALAAMGLLDDAEPLFASVRAAPKAGVLLAMPALVASGVFDAAKAAYGSIGPAFHGLRTTLVVLLTLALLRVKRPEKLTEYSPPELGLVVGLDRCCFPRSSVMVLAR